MEIEPIIVLQQKREELNTAFLAGMPVDLLTQNAIALDQYFFDQAPKNDIPNTCAIAAVGGYGRREQAVHSDVDLLFIFKNKVPLYAEALVRAMIYPLWDAGLKVGNATRTIKECLQLCHNIDVLTTQLDARFLCGSHDLYTAFTKQFKKKIIQPKQAKNIRQLVQACHTRRRHFGDSPYLLEPNLKEGLGGLRDYHAILWIAKMRGHLQDPKDLEYSGSLSHDEYVCMQQALEFIWKVRNHLHLLSAIKADQLYFEKQEHLAEILGFVADKGQTRVEKFLAYLHQQMDVINHQFLMFLYELGYHKPEKKGRQTGTQYTGITVKPAVLSFSDPRIILEKPQLLMYIFEEAARLDIPLSAESRRLVSDFLNKSVDQSFRTNPEVVKSFEKILLAPAATFDVLHEMLITGFLTRFIPEFKAIVNRIQYNQYHLYPVDKHSLHTVRILKSFGRKHASNFFEWELYRQLPQKQLLLWAGLLHDIGKHGQTDAHSLQGADMAEKILARMGYCSKDIGVVFFLIKEHLSLIITATRRDIDDEQTVILFARSITLDRLKMLYLLTIADSRATGPKAFNDWTMTLLKEFFLKVVNILEYGGLAAQGTIEIIEVKRKFLLSLGQAELFDLMPPRYKLNLDEHDMLKHIELYENMGTSFNWLVENLTDDTRQITICAHDFPGLFAKIAGTLALNGISILDVHAYTWKNHIALDIFKVRPPVDRVFEEEKWVKIKQDLKTVFKGNLDLEKAIQAKRVLQMQAPGLQNKTKVQIDNKTSSFFTLVEVFADDFTGLLYTITDTLFKCGLNIHIAKIATKIDQVVDVFYVRNLDGQKIHGQAESDIIKKVLTALDIN